MDTSIFSRLLFIISKKFKNYELPNYLFSVVSDSLLIMCFFLERNGHLDYFGLFSHLIARILFNMLFECSNFQFRKVEPVLHSDLYLKMHLTYIHLLHVHICLDSFNIPIPINFFFYLYLFMIVERN